MVSLILLFFAAFLIVLGITVITHLIFLVPYVPTSRKVAERMLKAAELKPRETVYDLGCGDARLLIAAEKRTKIIPVGFEIAPLPFLLALMRKLFARSKVRIHFKNFFKAHLGKANVIFCYLFPETMAKLAKKFKSECKRGTRIISNTFHIPGMSPYRVIAKDPKKGLPTIYVYRI